MQLAHSMLSKQKGLGGEVEDHLQAASIMKNYNDANTNVA